MQRKKLKIKYDREARILSIRLAPQRGVDSDIYDNVVVDNDKQGKPVNIDILSFSLADFRRIPNSKKLISVTA